MSAKNLSGTYAKLSPTVFLYINSAAVSKSDVKDTEFVKLLLTETEKFVQCANLVPLKALQYQDNLKRWSATAR